MLKDLVKKCRSYRRFFQEVSIPYEDLKDMVDTARLTGCTKNCQGLKFKLISTPEECAKVFPSLLWAGALKTGTDLQMENVQVLMCWYLRIFLLEKI